MIKQVIVFRNDLKMPTGKAIAQGAHASMKVFFDRISDLDPLNGFDEGYPFITIPVTPEMHAWICGIFTKITLGCDSETELQALYEAAKAKDLPCSLIQDAGKTVFNVPTVTCIAIGPAKSDQIDPITGHLKMYKL
jgi:PTH2 family peptidyl-tRNA hydrolase